MTFVQFVFVAMHDSTGAHDKKTRQTVLWLDQTQLYSNKRSQHVDVVIPNWVHSDTSNVCHKTRFEGRVNA